MLFVQNVPHKRQPACLPPQRSRPDTQKEGVAGLELGRIEIANEKLALLAAVIVDRRNKVVPQMLKTGEIRNLPRTQFLRQRKFCPRREPARKVISLAVI